MTIDVDIEKLNSIMKEIENIIKEMETNLKNQMNVNLTQTNAQKSVLDVR